MLGKQVDKPGVGNQAAGGFGGAAEHDCVPMRGQFSGNRQGPCQQAEIIGGQGREQKLRHAMLLSLGMVSETLSWAMLRPPPRSTLFPYSTASSRSASGT